MSGLAVADGANLTGKRTKFPDEGGALRHNHIRGIGYKPPEVGVNYLAFEDVVLEVEVDLGDVEGVECWFLNPLLLLVVERVAGEPTDRNIRHGTPKGGRSLHEVVAERNVTAPDSGVVLTSNLTGDELKVVQVLIRPIRDVEELECIFPVRVPLDRLLDEG